MRRGGLQPWRQRLGELDGALARRVDQHLVERQQRSDRLRGRREQVRGLEARAGGEAVERGILAGAAHRRVAALDADDLGAAARDR